MVSPKKGKNSARKPSTSRRPVREGKTASATEKAQANLKSAAPSLSAITKFRPITYALVAAIVIIVGGWAAYSKVYADPARVFKTMVSNNLATEGFTRQTDQMACVPNAQSTNIIQTSFVPSLSLHCITHISNGSAKLTIESIGNAQADYQRYSSIQTAGASSGKYSKVYDMWLKNSGSDTAQPNLYSQLLNTPVLFGDLSPSQRSSLVASLLGVYQVSYKNLVKQTHSGRQTYTYSVTIPLKKFAVAEKSYADMLNLPNANRINPESYPSSSKVDVKFSVDVLSRQLTQVQFQNVKENYSGYGISPQVKLPATTVSLQQLQNAFQSVSK